MGQYSTEHVAAARDLMRLGGVDSSSMTDDEVVEHAEAASRRISEAVRMVGISAEEAAQSLTKLAQVLASSHRPEAWRG